MVGIFSRFSSGRGSHRRSRSSSAEIWVNTKELMVEAKQLYTELSSLSIRSNSHRGSFAYPFAIPDLPNKIVGFNAPLEELERKLLFEDAYVIGVCALGRCGKTTLVAKLCQDEKIQKTPNLLEIYRRLWAQLVNDARETVLPISETSSSVAVIMPHGVEAAVDFKPIEHPIEPPDNDHPVTCPAPEPSISSDGKMWKERMAANSRRQSDVSITKDGETQGLPENAVLKHASPGSMSVLLPFSIPEKQDCETPGEVQLN